MSVATELTRISNARNAIRTKMVSLGISQSSDDITDLAEDITNIVDRGNPSAQVKEGESYTIQAGYYRGGTVTGIAGGGQYTLQAKTGITPTTQQQTISPDAGYYGLSSVQINPIPSNYKDVSSVTATAADVLATKIFVDSTGAVVAGTNPNNGEITGTITGLGAVAGDTYFTIPAGYTSGGTVSLTNDIETALAGI